MADNGWDKAMHAIKEVAPLGQGELPMLIETALTHPKISAEAAKIVKSGGELAGHIKAEVETHPKTTDLALAAASTVPVLAMSEATHHFGHKAIDTPSQGTTGKSATVDRH